MEKTPTSAAAYLDLMADYALALCAAGIDQAGWAEDLRYIRVNGGGLRPISICNNNPCGALVGYGRVKSKVNEQLMQARNAPAQVPSAKASKPELRLQARLIEHALRSPQTLPALLHLTDQCDELRFVTDELRVGDIRADVVLLGSKDGVWFPAFIELKNGRELKRLLQQLRNIVRYVSDEPDARLAFARFAMAAAGAKGEFDFGRLIEIIIWPALPDPSRASEETRALLKGRHVLEFPEGALRDPLPRMGLSFVKQDY